MKRLFTSCAALALAISVLAGCGGQEPIEAEAVTTAPQLPAAAESEPTPEATPTEDGQEPWVGIYEPIIRSYYDTLSKPLDAEALFNSELCFLCLYSYEGDPLMNVGWRYADLDGDGSMELLIGAISEDEYLKNVLFDLYTIADGQPVQVLQSQERQRYFLDASGRVITDWANSAAEAGQYELEYSAGTLTELGPVESPELIDLGLTPIKDYLR